MRVRDDYRTITGVEKAAILLMSLNQDQAAKIFANLDDEEIKEISQSMSNLGNVSSEVVDRLFVEFAEKVSSSGLVIGSAESAQRLLSEILGGDKVEEIMEEIHGPAGRTMWDKLGNVNAEVLANYLTNEYPQTVAVILGKIDKAHAAEVLAALPENYSSEVVMRMLHMEVVDKQAEKDIERVLRTEFMSNLARTNRRDSHALMADIFNNLDSATEERFLNALAERSKDSAEKVRALMFTFEDLDRLDQTSVRTLIRLVDNGVMTLALKGASEQIKEMFFENMSQRSVRLMKDDMVNMGPVRLSEVERAQLSMVQLATDLSERGEISMIARNGGADEFIS
ncbi:MAG: flagellar motor switch protein FliG [Thalassobaculaceae bacterium]